MVSLVLVAWQIIAQFVLVCRTLWVVLRIVNLNASSVPSVPRTKLVLINAAEILVPVLVDKMRAAELRIIRPYALVWKAIPEIPSISVCLGKVCLVLCANLFS